MPEVGMALRIRFPYLPPQNTRMMIDRQLKKSGASAWMISRGSCCQDEPEYRVFSVKFLAQQSLVRSVFQNLHELPTTDEHKQNFPDGDLDSDEYDSDTLNKSSTPSPNSSSTSPISSSTTPSSSTLLIKIPPHTSCPPMGPAGSSGGIMSGGSIMSAIGGSLLTIPSSQFTSNTSKSPRIPPSDIIIERCVFQNNGNSGNSSPRRKRLPLDPEERIQQFFQPLNEVDLISRSSPDSCFGLMRTCYTEMIFSAPLTRNTEYITVPFYDGSDTPQSVLVDAGKKLHLDSPISHIWSKDGVVYDILDANDVCSSYWVQKDFLYCITVKQCKDLRVALSTSLEHVLEATYIDEPVKELGITALESMKNVDLLALTSEKRKRFQRTCTFLPILTYLNERIHRLQKK